MKKQIQLSIGLVFLFLSATDTLFAQRREIIHEELLAAIQTEVSMTSEAQVIRGTVHSSDENEPLVGVNITLAGTQMGTTTDHLGNFEFPVKLNEGQQIVFSYVGFETQTYTVRGNESVPIMITMKVDGLILTGAIPVCGLVNKKENRLIAAVKKIFK